MAGSKMTNVERITKLLEMIAGLDNVGMKVASPGVADRGWVMPVTD